MMAKLKKAKKAKPAIEQKLSRDEKKYLKTLAKDAKKLKKRVDRAVSVTAVLLCIISSVLDIILENKTRRKD